MPHLKTQRTIRSFCLALGCLLLTSAGCDSPEAARRKIMENNLKQVQEAIDNYNQKLPAPAPAESVETEQVDESSQ